MKIRRYGMTANELTIHRPLDKDQNNYTRSTTGLQL